MISKLDSLPPAKNIQLSSATQETRHQSISITRHSQTCTKSSHEIHSHSVIGCREITENSLHDENEELPHSINGSPAPVRNCSPSRPILVSKKERCTKDM